MKIQKKFLILLKVRENHEILFENQEKVMKFLDEKFILFYYSILIFKSQS